MTDGSYAGPRPGCYVHEYYGFPRHTIFDVRQLRTRALAEVIRQIDSTPDVRYVRIESTPIGPETAQCLAAALRGKTQLSHLVITDAKLGSVGVQPLADMVASHPSLRFLNLGHNYLRAPGVKAVAQALRTNNRMEQLFLWGNHLGNGAVQALADGLVDSAAPLWHLDLSINMIGNTGAQYLLDTLAPHQTIRRLCMQHNNIDVDDVAKH